MAYIKQDFKSGEILKAAQLNAMDEQIAATERALDTKQPLGEYLTEHQQLKTINGVSIVGEGDVSFDVLEDSRVSEMYELLNGGQPISITDLSVYEQHVGYPNQPTSSAHWVVKDTFKHIVIPVPESGCKLKIVNGNSALMYCGLQSYTVPTSSSSELVYGESGDWTQRWTLTANAPLEKDIPDDVHYILLVVLNNGVEAYPTSFELTKDVAKGLKEEVRQLNSSLTPLKGKTLFAFGDSITYGYITIDGVRQDVRYTEVIKERLGCNIQNYGSSGAATGRLCDIMTGGEVSRKSDVDPSEPSLCTDYSDADIVTIMIGTNSGIYVGGVASKKEDIPAIYGATVKTIADGGSIVYGEQTISTLEEYWNLFPNSFHGNLALCIEWVQWKNPNAKIYLITPPANNIGEWRGFIYSEVRPALYEIAHHYGVEVIDAQVNCGISMHNLLDYTFDGVHFNQDGCKKWGNYIADQLK